MVGAPADCENGPKSYPLLGERIIGKDSTVGQEAERIRSADRISNMTECAFLSCKVGYAGLGLISAIVEMCRSNFGTFG